MAEPHPFGPEAVPRRSLTARMRKFRGKLLVASGPHAVELDELGAFVFRRVDGSATVQGIAEQLAAEYDVSVEVAAQDIGELLAQLADSGMVEAAGP
ncbi:PqqD family protein [Streptomyces monomycini]|uniref:PqqD family protein n=1 Tax=Streptomyces monomycini TaxID=371720 RepID=UPI0004AB4228|nr:PqqD family protein [Streptomyces monomycini]